MRSELELAAARRALDRLAELPAEAFLAVNVSPETAVTAGFRRLVSKYAAERLVLEVTEHAPIHDYTKLNTGLRRVRDLGARLAIDDAGAGFASLRHILRLAPEFIKLDMSLIAGIE